MRKPLVLAALLAALITTVYAITGGTVDTTNTHPNVGIVVLRVGPRGARICSGTLIHPRVVLTAGHCVAAFQAAFDAGASDISRLSVNFVSPHAPGPVGGDNREVESIVLHPDFDPRLIPNEGTDIGLLILKDPVVGIAPASLPGQGMLDSLKKSGALRQRPPVRVAGFGTFLDPSAPPTPTLGNPPWPRRYVDVKFKGLLKSFFQLTNNANSGDGGSCFGDSGGPAFWTDASTGARTLVGVTSWGDMKCVGTGVYARTDLKRVLDFINDNLPR